MLNAKNRKNEDHGEDGEEHAGDGADSLVCEYARTWNTNSLIVNRMLF